MAAYEILLLNTAIPQIQAAQSGDTYVVPRDIAFSTVANLANGTNLLPSLTFSSDTNTGIYREGADALGFTAGGGTNQMVLTSTGLGIGTSSPAYRLQVQSAGTGTTAASNIVGRFQTNGSGYDVFVQLSDNVANSGGIGMVGGAMYLANGTTRNLTLDSSGNLGIGTTSPSPIVAGSRVLEVSGAGDYFPSINLARTGASGYTNVNWKQFLSSDGGLYFRQNSTDRMVLDSSGNLGLGVTPSAWEPTMRAFQVANVGAHIAAGMNNFSGSQQLFIGNNSHFNSSGQHIYARTNPAALYRQLDNSHLWLTAPSGTANSASVTSGASYTVVALGSSTLAQWQAFFNDSSNNPLTVTPTLGQVLTGNATGTLLGGGLVTQNISFTQAMTLDASGNLGIGTSSPSFSLDISAASPRIRQTATTGTNSSLIQLVNTGGTAYIGLDNSSAGISTAYSLNLYHSGAYPIVFSTSGTERARITSGGDLLVGTATAGAGIGFDVKLAVDAGSGETSVFKTSSSGAYPSRMWNSATTGDNTFSGFLTEGGSGTLRGNITYNRAGGLVAYNTTSDYRAKNIIGPVQNPGATIDALKVYEGVMKGATQSRPMLIAHEAQQHAPYAVSGVKDEVNEDGTPKLQQMDVSSLVPLLLVEIQSLRARVAQLEQGA